MLSYITHVMTLANSIIGVSVLAMPYCFKQCGILLAMLILVFCSLLSRLACHFLIKSAVMSRRRNYEFLAFHAFGPMGKFLVELFIIGFLLGTCIAFFVVTGDLGPQIIGKILNKNPEDIRMSFLLTTGLIIVLPLGLLKNIDSLSSICTVTIGFYLCLVIKVISEAMRHIFDGDWMDDVNYWRTAGILQCLPIFSMALFCQTQLFEIYESIPNVSLEKMNIVVKGAINICTIVYLFVGFFGYVAFCTQSFSGNILTSFEASLTSDCIKIGFVLSVLFSFPLVIFPCRASLNSLLFRRNYAHESSTNYIPEIRFRCLTLMIVLVSLITGLLMPNIEFVLGLVGSTIGVIICLIFPAGFFIAISTKNTNERLLAQVILFIGMWIMILGSYANLYAMDESSTTKISIGTKKPFVPINNIHLNVDNDNVVEIPRVIDILPEKEKLNKNDRKLKDFPKPWELQSADKLENEVAQKLPVNLTSVDNKNPSEDKTKNEEPAIKLLKVLGADGKLKVLSAEDKMKMIEDQEKSDPEAENSINVDAIKREESEIADADIKDPSLQEQQRVKETLEQHKIESIELMKEQKAILKNIAIEKEEMKKDKKLLESQAVSSEKIAENKVNDKNNKIHINTDHKIQEINVNKSMNLNSSDKIDEGNKLGTIVPLDAKINVPSNESRGPVLNALTSWTVNQVNNDSGFSNSKDNHSINNNIVIHGNNDNKNKNNNDNNLKSANEVPIPLPLKLNKSAENISEDKVEQNILQDRGREKRDIEEFDKIILDKAVKSTNEECTSKPKEEKSYNTKSIIKTNINLSDQMFTKKLNSVDLSLDPAINSEYGVFKKRDLKAFKPGRRRD